MVKHTQFVGNLPTNCLSVFDHFMGLALKGLNNTEPNEPNCYCGTENLFGDLGSRQKINP